MAIPLRVLLIEDNPDDAVLLKRELEHGGYVLYSECVLNREALIAAIERESWDVILADYSLPQFDAPSALAIVRARLPETPFIIISGTMREDTIVHCMRNGANDFFVKGRTTLLPLAIEREMQAAEERRRRNEAERSLRETERRLARLFQSSPVPYSVTRIRDQRILEVNKAYTEMTGYSADELIGHTVMELGIWVDESERMALIDALTGSLPVRNFEFQARTKDGRVGNILLTADIIAFHDEPCVLSMALDITELKRAEETHRLQAHLLNAVGQAVVVTDMNGNIQYWNGVAEKLYGWTAEEAIGQNTNALIAGQASSAGSEILDELSTVGLWAGEFDIVRKDGTTLPIFVTTSALSDEHGQPSGIVAVGADISALKRVEKQLRDSEELHRVILENIYEAILMTDSSGRFTFVSPSAEHVFQHSVDDITALSTVQELLGHRVLEMQQLHADGDSAALDFEYVAPDGSVRFFSGYVKRVTIGDGSFLFILRDITEHRQAVDALRTSELRFRLITENARDLYLLTDADGRCIYASPSYHRLLGYDPAAMVGTYPFDEITHPDDWSTSDGWDTKNGWRSMSTSRGRLRARNGSWVWVDGYTYVIQIEGRDYIVGIGRDISERLQLENERLERERLSLELKQQKDLNELKSRFVSMVSHEFRTPLAAIQTSSDLLKHYHDRMTVERRDEHLTQIGEQVRQLTHLLDEVLTLSRAETIGLAFEPVSTNMDIFIRSVVAAVERAASAPGRIHVDVEPLEAEIDQKLFGQALNNLLGNALKYSPPDRPVRVRANAEQGHLNLTVSDEGIGIPEEDQARLFEAFHRAGNVGTIAGTGLGLAIVKRAIDTHNGSVAHSSREGQGTTFSVRVPLVSTEKRVQ